MANRRRPNGRQGRKDDSSKRDNLDNVRVDKLEKEFDKEARKKTSKCNDASWYAHNPELLKSAASLPFSTVTGQNTPFTSTNALPGVVSLVWNPSVGGSYHSWDAINQAAKSVYSFTVHANSRNQSYDANDEMLLIMAGAQAFAMLANGIRAYGIMKTFDQRNSYLPRGLVRAIGFDYDDLKNNLSKMWFDINQMVAASAQLWIPNNMPVITRWFWLNSNIYQDSTSVKGQYYVFTQRKYLKYDETTHTNGTSLQILNYDGTAANTWAQYMTALNELFDALLNSQDRGIMMGDILKAYGEDRIYRLSEIPSDYTLVPTYDPEVLSQIENAICTKTDPGVVAQNPLTPGNPELSIIQSWGSVTTIDQATVNRCAIPSTSILNFHGSTEPTPEQIMVATRLKPAGTVIFSSGGVNQIYPLVAGTEIPYQLLLYRYDYSGGQPVLTVSGFNSFWMEEAGALTVDVAGEFIAEMETFDWHPFLYAFNGNLPTTAGSYYLVPHYGFGDYDNYTYINFDELAKMHTCALFSEFGVPTL